MADQRTLSELAAAIRAPQMDSFAEMRALGPQFNLNETRQDMARQAQLAQIAELRRATPAPPIQVQPQSMADYLMSLLPTMGAQAAGR